MDYHELSFAVRLLNPLMDQPPVRVKRESLNRLSGREETRFLDLFFGDNSEVFLSRNDVFKRSHGTNDKFVLSVLFWGFPANRRGICAKAFQNWPHLLDWIGYLRGNRELTRQQFDAIIPQMHNMHGLGISMFSKYLYFTGCSINGHRCLILDDQVAKGISRLAGNEFDGLKAATQDSHYRFYKNYPSCLEAMENLANQLGVSGDQLEYVLWLAGKKRL